MDAALSRFGRRSLPALIFFAAFALPAAAAHAAEPNPDVLAKITKLNKKAIDAYQKQDFDTARDALKQALEACNAAHLEHHPITARTEIHIGVLLIGGLKQHNAGVKHFQKALQIQPDIQITKTLVTPELQDAFEEAVLGAGSGGGDEGGGGGGSTKRRPPSDDEGAGAGSSEGGEASGGDEDQPRKRPPVSKKKPPKKRGGDDDESDDGKDEEEGPQGAAGDFKGKIFIGFMFGTGFGVASGTGETTPASNPVHKLSSPGFALAQSVQLAPEVGYFMSSSLMVSLQVRYQIITGTTPATNGGSAPGSAVAALARGTLFMGASGSFRPFVDVAVGGGYIRHAVQFSKGNGCGPCVDTFKGGPFLIGPGGGFLYDLGTLGILVQLNTQLGLPNFTFNLDGQLGAALKF